METFSIMRMDEEHLEEICLDVKRQYDEGIANVSTDIPFQNIVNLSNGEEINVCCPFDDGYMEYLEKIGSELAKHNPAVICSCAGEAAMSLSSFCVVTNALRLNFIDIYSTKHDRKIKTNHKSKETKEMEKIMKIEGMMCPHCEARVKKVLEELDGVTEVIPSHKDGKATVKMSKDVDDALLKKTVEDQGYTVL